MNNIKKNPQTKGDLATLGLGIGTTGMVGSGCLIMTVIGIPLLVVTLPIMALGYLVLGVSPFLPTVEQECPKCHTSYKILKQRKAFECNECGSKLLINQKGKIAITF